MAPSPELIVSLTYLADHTRRVHFGSLVAPLSVRDPVMLAQQAVAIDDLSGGRLVLGLGVGYSEYKHKMQGYQLGSKSERIQCLEERLEAITRLFNSDEIFTYEGQTIQLHDARLMPWPQRPDRPSIMIGGNGVRRTLPLVARYADVWNVMHLTPSFSRSGHKCWMICYTGRAGSPVT